MTARDKEQPPPLRVSRTLHAPRTTVFAAWGTADHVRAWFSPETYTVSDAAVDFRAGGAFDVCMRSPGGTEHWTRGTFVEVTPHTRLVIDMHVAGTAGEPLFRAYTEVTFSDALGGTKLDVVQTYTFVDPQIAAGMVAGAAEGWSSTLDKLEREVIAMQGGSGTGTRSAVHATFRLERTYDASVGSVWHALTNENAKQKWFGGTARQWEPIERHMDVRVGGREVVKGRWESGLVTTFDAIYHDVVPSERLVYSYTMFMDDKKISVSLSTLELKGDGAQTTLAITEQGAFLDGYDDAGSREHGNEHLLEAIGRSLEQ